MGLNGLLGLARDALTAQAYALDVVGQNVANASTPGYVRRDVILQNRAAGTGGQPGGVVALGVRRSVDQFVDSRVFESAGLATSAQTRDNNLARIEGLFDDLNGTGLGSTISQLFGSFSALAAAPSDTTTRSMVLQSASSFVTRVNDVANSIAQHRADMLNDAQATVAQINGVAEKIGTLNDRIKTAEGSGADASDLRDEQGKLVRELSDMTDVHTFHDASGSLVVRAAGVTLVEGNKAAQLSVSTVSDGTMHVYLNRPSAAPVDVTSHLNGGKLAGLKQARDVDAVAASAKLDQLVADIAGAINVQHAAGFGLDGVNGRALFSGTTSAATLAVDSAMVGRPDRVAASSSAATIPGGSDNAAAISQLQNSAFASGGTRTAAQAYADIVGDVAQRRSDASKESSLRGAMLDQAQAMQSSVSGVSVDEEMVNLTKYQRSYEAASKLVQTADQLLQDLMQRL